MSSNGPGDEAPFGTDADPTGAGRSWPFVLIGMLIALGVGAVIYVAFLAPGGPTVDQPAPSVPTLSPSPSVSASASPTPSASTRSPAPSPSPSRTVAAPPVTDPGDVIDNPIEDAIVAYPGTPLRRTASTAPVDEVRIVQQRLEDLGYTVRVDGVFGARTETAVKRFQADTGLAVDGIVGRRTWDALFTSEG